MENIKTQGGIEVIPLEILISILDPEKNPTAENHEALQTPPDLLQALLILQPIFLNTTTPDNQVQLKPENELKVLEIQV